MDELRKQILSLTGKYDKLVQDVKNLKTKIKKDESTINLLQKEVTRLKQQQRGSTNLSAHSSSKSMNNLPVSTSPPVQTNNNAGGTAMDPLDVFFTGAPTTTQSTNNTANVNTAQSTNTGGGGADFGGWTTF